MKAKILFILAFLFACLVPAQNEFHVSVAGSPNGDGSEKKPWDLQTALNQDSKVIAAGDIVWLHQGIYNGRYTSRLSSKRDDKKILVSSFPGEWAILNANINSEGTAALNVTGSNVIYRNFEVAPIDLKTRNEKDEGFKRFDGIFHTNGRNCEFINLVIHGNNGLGFGSWKKTGGTLITNCLIYDNGYINLKGRGIGEGMYVQNDSDSEIRMIKDNIIFNNYYKGIEVWSAAKKANFEYVKNVHLDNNVIFNSGLVANRTVDNIIVATDDGTGTNRAKNIKITNNILYHNTDYTKNEVNGDAPSLTLGYRVSAPIDHITIRNNIILGRNNPVRLLYAEHLDFHNNLVYGGYMHIMNSNFEQGLTDSWSFNNNSYFTKNSTPMLLIKNKKTIFKDWQSQFGFDKNSKWNYTREFSLPNVLDISKNEHKINEYRVVLFEKSANNILVDFSKFNIKEGTGFVIRDVENYDKTLIEGAIPKSSIIEFPMKTNIEEKDETVLQSTYSLSNFGVFLIQFQE